MYKFLLEAKETTEKKMNIFWQEAKDFYKGSGRICSTFALSVLLCVFGGCSSSNIEKELRGIDAGNKYFVSSINSPITVDGIDNEMAWKNVKYSTPFVDILTGEKAEYSTHFKCIKDHQNVYFFIQLEEPHIRGLMTTPDTSLYNENCFEIFIDPDNDGENYLELEINALETKFDLTMDKSYQNDGKANIPYSVKGLKHKTYIEGTINNPTDIDKYWNIECSIPLSTIFALTKSPPQNQDFFWRIHMARMQFPVNLYEGEYTSKPKELPKVWVWNQQSKFDNHLPKEWGYIVFK